MMHPVTFTFIASLGFILLGPVTIGQKVFQAGGPCDNNTIAKIDNLVTSILPFNKPQVPPPEKLEDIPEFCRFYGGVLKTVEDINKRCMTDTYKNIISLVVYNIRKNSKNVCSKRGGSRPTPAKRDFLTVSKCVNSGSARIEKCARISKAHLVSIPNAPLKQRLPLLCCEYFTIRQCILSSLSHEPGCSGPQNLQYMKKMIENLGASALNLACGDGAEAKCHTLALPKRKKSQKIPKSYLIPILNILESL